MVLYYVIDLYTLKSLPLLTRSAVIGFFLTEFNYKFEGQLNHLRPVPRFRIVPSQPLSALFSFLKFIVCLGAIIFDLFYEEIVYR